MIMYRVADGDLEKITWINKNLEYPEVIKWLGIRLYLNRKDLEAAND